MSSMDVAPPPKVNDVGEEDLVDYEEEEVVQTTDKPSENGKEGTKKYAITS